MLDGIEVACFDLFETLVTVDTRDLPHVDFDGTSVRSTIPLLHERFFASRGVALDDLVRGMRSMWIEVRKELRRTDGTEDERLREISSAEKFGRLVAELGVARGDEAEALADEVATHHHAVLISAACALDGAREVLAAVRERGIPTVLVSNWDHADAGPAMLAQTGLSELLDHVVISEAVGYRKPHSKIFREALAPFSSEPEAALHVGDLAEPDAFGAGRLGFKTVWLDRKQEGWNEALGPVPTLTLGHISELIEHL
jgi:HAD superfamily hydrolase (TIGR01509 family)